MFLNVFCFVSFCFFILFLAVSFVFCCCFVFFLVLLLNFVLGRDCNGRMQKRGDGEMNGVRMCDVISTRNKQKVIF